MNKPSSLEKITVSPKKTATGSVIWLHGLGADGYDFSGIVPLLNLPKDLHIRFIFPHAPIRPITINANLRTRAWYDIYSLSDLNHEDEPGIKQTQESIHELIQHEMTNGIDSNRILLAGFSQGGAMALYAGLRYEKPLNGILALSAYLPLPQQFQKEVSPANQNIPIFMAHGKHDPVLPMTLGYQTYQLLKKSGHPIDWHEYDMDHQVCPEEIEDIGRWLTKRLSQP